MLDERRNWLKNEIEKANFEWKNFPKSLEEFASKDDVKDPETLEKMQAKMEEEAKSKGKDKGKKDNKKPGKGKPNETDEFMENHLMFKPSEAVHILEEKIKEFDT